MPKNVDMPKQKKGVESFGVPDSRPDAKGWKIGGPTPVNK